MTTNLTLKKLIETFPPKQTAPDVYCLVIPGIKWDPDWEAQIPAKNKVAFEGEFVTVALPGYTPPQLDKASSSKIDDNSSSKNAEHKSPGRPRGCGGRRATGNWKLEAEKLLIEEMGRRDLVQFPMLQRARKILQEKPELFPDRTALALTQHYKQITTPAERACALAESLKPPMQKLRWENTNNRQEKYTLEKDGLKCQALCIFEKGSLQRVSAIVLPAAAGNGQTAAIVVNELPVDVVRLLNGLVDQLQEPQQ